MQLNILLLGVQGSGKGTQAAFLQDKYGVVQLSTGDLFRAMRSRTDAFAQEIQALMADGTLIDDATTNRVVQEFLERPDVAKGVIFDGYPRTPAQAAWLDTYLASKGAKINAVIVLDLDLFVGFKRAFGRLGGGDGAHNLYFNNDGLEITTVEHPEKTFPARLDVTVTATGEQLTRRPDDANAHAIIKRIDSFVQTTQMLIEHYPKGLVHRVDAAQSIEKVRAEIERIIQQSQ
jgi:adenylate kinase